MARKPRGPEDYTRAELLIMAERVGLKYRSRKSKEQLYEALGLGPSAGKAGKPSSRRAAAQPAQRPAGRAAPAPAPAARGKSAPLGLPEAAVSTAAATSSIPLPSAPAPARTGPYVDRGPELPAGYGEDLLVALVRDPRALFVYWEVSSGGIERIRAERGESALAGAVWVLRVTRVDNGQFFDVPMDPAAGNWYLSVEPAGRYQVKVGLVLASGSFVELAASAVVATPPETVSERIDEEWMLVNEEFDRLIEWLVRERGKGPGSAQMGRLMGQRRERRRLALQFPWNISSRISSGAISSRISSSSARR